jgi:hypothetical protein
VGDERNGHKLINEGIIRLISCGYRSRRDPHRCPIARSVCAAAHFGVRVAGEGGHRAPEATSGASMKPLIIHRNPTSCDPSRIWIPQALSCLDQRQGLLRVVSPDHRLVPKVVNAAVRIARADRFPIPTFDPRAEAISQSEAQQRTADGSESVQLFTLGAH